MYRLLFVQVKLVIPKQRQPGTYAIAIVRRAFQFHSYIGLVVFVVAFVFIYQHRIVDIVYHYIQIAIVIQIGIHGSIGEGGLIITYLLFQIGKRQVTRILKKLIRDLYLWEFLGQRQVFFFLLIRP